MLQEVADGKRKRVMIFMPPRIGKSEIVSRLFTSYFLYRYPEKWVGLASYSANLANSLSRNSRENYRLATNELSKDASAVSHWETGYGGGFWAGGVGGPATGKGFHLGVVDDPVKNAEEAASTTIQERNQDWWNSTFYSREEGWSDTDPNGAIIVLQTRWHEADLSGWLLEKERIAVREDDTEDAEHWHVVNLPALADDAEFDWPETITLEPDWRKVGDAICPERRPEAKLRKIKKRIGDYYFDALYQQRPSPKEGVFFKVLEFATQPVAPAGLRWVRAWDLAASKDSGAYTVGVKMAVDNNGVYWVSDVVRGQWSAEEVRKTILETAKADGQEVSIYLPQDPGQAGKDQAEQLIKFLAGYEVKAEPQSGSKEVRAFSFAAQVNAGNVKLVAGDWVRPFIEEHRQFPRGKYVDQCDAAASAFNEIALNLNGWQQGRMLR